MVFITEVIRSPSKKSGRNINDRGGMLKTHLGNFDEIHFMFWAPVVPKGFLTEELPKIDGFELYINNVYKNSVGELQDLAKKTTRDIGNHFLDRSKYLNI